MILRRLIVACLLAAIAAVYSGCNNDRQIIDKHQGIIDEEEED